MKKYWTIFRVELENTMAFRGPALIWVIFDLLWIAVFPFVWFLIIQAQGGEIRGWDGGMIVMYYVFMAVLNNMILMHPEVHTANEIYEGKLSNFITKPHSYMGYVFLHEAAWKIVRTILFIPVFIVLAYVALRFGGIFGQVGQLPEAALASLLAVPIYFLAAFIIGMTSFWLEDSYVASTIFWASTGLFGGQYAPFEFMPRVLNQIASFLPFKYTMYFPLQLVSRVVPQEEIIRGMSIQILWIVLLFVCATVVWRLGVKRYSAVGR